MRLPWKWRINDHGLNMLCTLRLHGMTKANMKVFFKSVAWQKPWHGPSAITENMWWNILPTQILHIYGKWTCSEHSLNAELRSGHKMHVRWTCGEHAMNSGWTEWTWTDEARSVHPGGTGHTTNMQCTWVQILSEPPSKINLQLRVSEHATAMKSTRCVTNLAEDKGWIELDED